MPSNRETIETLLTAKILLRSARPLCHSQDRHSASAGLLVLHDALEQVLFACLRAKRGPSSHVDVFLKFDELLKQLAKEGVATPEA